ncbi:MAG: DUF6206 family protein [Fidelibacterota bacterium]
MQNSDKIIKILQSFEKEIIPWKFKSGTQGANIIGYGEISSVFSIDDLPDMALKRMPLFNSESEVEYYITKYEQYSELLKDAGLDLPDSATHMIKIPKRPVVLYLQQKLFDSDKFVHKLIHQWSIDEIQIAFNRILSKIEGVWQYSNSKSPEITLALDAQLSNWVINGSAEHGQIYYIDTSTPLYRLNGIEQLDAELFLKSAMPGLRWIIRKFFLDEIINRYYNKRSVLIDLAANLFKERKPDLIPKLLEKMNLLSDISSSPLSEKEIQSYYNEDKRIWQIVQFSRKFHRWYVTQIIRRRYEFILPDNINR